MFIQTFASDFGSLCAKPDKIIKDKRVLKKMRKKLRKDLESVWEKAKYTGV